MCPCNRAEPEARARKLFELPITVGYDWEREGYLGLMGFGSIRGQYAAGPGSDSEVPRLGHTTVRLHCLQLKVKVEVEVEGGHEEVRSAGHGLMLWNFENRYIESHALKSSPNSRSAPLYLTYILSTSVQ